jgi:hypothetical protein
MRDRPGVVLMRHFFGSLFDFGFLSEDGAESLKRALLGGLAVAIALGFLLTRMFMKKYGLLSGAPVEVYTRELVADHAFLIAVPMWIVAVAVGLVGGSLFPDRTDFRVLMAEPLSRRTIFASKLASLLLFAGLFIAGAHVALLPLTAFTLVAAIKTGTFVATAMSYAFSSVGGSLFAALAIVAVHGALALLAPPGRVLAFSGAVRSIVIGALVVSLPLIGRLPGAANAFASNAWWLPWVPPAWFVGLERWLTGDPTYAGLAAQAAIAIAIVAALSVASYLVLYRQFDRVLLQATSSQRPATWALSLNRWIGRKPVQYAIRRFVAITVQRSVLHQGLIVGLLAAAGGFVLNSLLSATGWSEPPKLHGRSPFLLTILWAPVTMMFLAIPAIRVALSVPLDLKSNWIFRVTEDTSGRAEVAAANIRIVVLHGVALPLALLGPAQWWVLGSLAAGIIALEALIGWLVVEWVMADWRRIPFTCSYIPGKGFVPHLFVKAVASYLVFTTAATLMLRVALALPTAGLIIALIAGGVAGALSWHRSRNAAQTPLLFDDEVPTDINPLRLNTD